jgi:hypothetical protein
MLKYDFAKNMTLSELKELDKASEAKIFTEHVTIDEAYSSGLIPAGYDNVFPRKCECGSEVIMSENRKHFMCCNPKCWIKLGLNLAEILGKFGIKSIGEESCKSLSHVMWKGMKTFSPIELMLYDFQVYANIIGPAKAMVLVDAVQMLRGKSFTFPKVAEMTCIPGFGKDVTFFENFSSMQNFAETLSEYKSVRVLLALGGILDLSKVFNLWLGITDLIMMSELIVGNVTAVGHIHYLICVTGEVSPEGVRVSKSEFLEMCNSFKDANGEKMFEVKMSQAMMSADYIIADYKSSSAKYRAGLSRGVLISSTDFLNKLKKEAEGSVR